MSKKRPKSAAALYFSGAFLELWYANRECKQDSRTYEHNHNADLHQGNKYQTRTRYIYV